MCSNMEYRMFLVQNADQIIANNQAAAIGNCSDITPILNTRPMAQTPHLFRSITANPLPEDGSSDLKDTFLQNYMTVASLSTPGIRIFQ